MRRRALLKTQMLKKGEAAFRSPNHDRQAIQAFGEFLRLRHQGAAQPLPPEGWKDGKAVKLPCRSMAENPGRAYRLGAEIRKQSLLWLGCYVPDLGKGPMQFPAKDASPEVQGAFPVKAGMDRYDVEVQGARPGICELVL